MLADPAGQRDCDHGISAGQLEPHYDAACGLRWPCSAAGATLRHRVETPAHQRQVLRMQPRRLAGTGFSG